MMRSRVCRSISRVLFPVLAAGLLPSLAAAPADLPRGEVQADTALVYVLRPAKAGFAVPAYFFVDDAFAGVNRGDSYFFLHVAPGRHLFWGRMENVDAFEAEVEAGKTYYIRQKTIPGLLAARIAVELLDPAEGEKILAQDVKHLSEVSAEERAHGEEHAKRLLEKARKDAAKKS